MTKLFAALACCMLSACATIPTPQERRVHADTLAAAKGWQASLISAGRFDLVAYAPRNPAPAERLALYIEGDGFAWASGSTPSTDPTPRDPLAMKLALAHPQGSVAYLARPCQYVDAARTGCARRYWTEERFAPEVVDAMDAAVDTLKTRFKARRLTLVGYSGGGNIAALLAARRDDVERLITVAGNLDHRAWTTHHRVRPLDGSLNAVDIVERLASLPQTHFIGGKDRVIPPLLAQRWSAALLGSGHDNLHILPDFDHVCCWAERWPSLIGADHRITPCCRLLSGVGSAGRPNGKAHKKREILHRGDSMLGVG